MHSGRVSGLDGVKLTEGFHSCLAGPPEGTYFLVTRHSKPECMPEGFRALVSRGSLVCLGRLLSTHPEGKRLQFCSHC